MLGILSFLAWAAVIIGWIGFSIDHTKAPEKKDEFTVSDAIALPGTVMYLMMPFALVGGFLYLLALPFM